MIPALLGPSAFNTAFFFHQVLIAEMKQVTHVELVAMFPVYTVVLIDAMVLAGLAPDRLGTVRVLPFIQIPMIAGYFCFSTVMMIIGVRCARPSL